MDGSRVPARSAGRKKCPLFHAPMIDAHLLHLVHLLTTSARESRSPDPEPRGFGIQPAFSPAFSRLSRSIQPVQPRSACSSVQPEHSASARPDPRPPDPVPGPGSLPEPRLSPFSHFLTCLFSIHTDRHGTRNLVMLHATFRDLATRLFRIASRAAPRQTAMNRS